MIYEVLTYDLKPGMVAELEKRFGEAYEHRRKYSELAAFWHSDIGPLNQVVHVWPYESIEERARIRAAVRKDAKWPPNLRELIVAARSEIATPAPFSPPLKPGTMGPYFEIRTYTLAPGSLPLAIENWTRVLPGRLAVGPLCAVWYSEHVGLHRWTHIWPYSSLQARTEVRDKAAAAGVWPPNMIARKEGRPAESFVAQENKIMMPAAFSPLK